MTNVLIRRGNLDTENYRKKTICGHGLKTDSCKSNRKASEESYPAYILILDF